ncbi:DUF4875 domain-containing protein [Vibrio alginolyticus]|uniref:DUF4875 domain-containing protein n=1 Tax=Vibrio alginolyticus TaxID=663 RepID=UPI00215CF9F6|nr:DUF4875 domain-containing protein [Vibrio alginolyticus]EIJ2375756.1 DUF4875 domain-containing protein [Vibrio alginolyticus]EIK0773784.1 DUF4875 domain-containing protein [Vibrio alginolyticus]EJU9538916.1 DUF4875 domain-containing protein [Vibrio alginolyticus]MCR9466680.1 DUF4875 domain-containing protein [Vibrio alginolyticus]MCR9482594.1 DUF4875 domain-containing protein [Vibrio alginolyticus]
MNKTLLPLLPMLALGGCGDPSPQTEEAKAYEVVSTKDFSFGGRERIEIVVVSPNATNRAEFAQTAISAAYKQQDKTKADVVSVRLEPSKNLVGYGFAYAIASYAPDGRGNSGEQDWKWDVAAAETSLDSSKVNIAEQWYAHRASFQEDGMTNEKELISFLAKKNSLSEKDIRLPWVSRSKYPVE